MSQGHPFFFFYWQIFAKNQNQKSRFWRFSIVKKRGEKKFSKSHHIFIFGFQLVVQNIEGSLFRCVFYI
jgi:hypothetical protein